MSASCVFCCITNFSSDVNLSSHANDVILFVGEFALFALFVARDVPGAVLSASGAGSQGLSKVPSMPSRVAWVRLGLGLGFSRLLVFFF